MVLEIRAPRYKDEIEQAVNVAVDLKHTEQEGRWFDEEAIPSIKRSLETEHSLVAVYNGVVIGFATFKKKGLFPWTKDWELSWIGVLRRFHRTDLRAGEKLIEGVVSEIKKAGGEFLFVETVSPVAKYENEQGKQSVENYKKTRMFYRKQGFKWHSEKRYRNNEIAMYILKI